MNKFMKLAIKEAREGILNGDGGPFGAIIVKEGKIIGKGHNKVVRNNDPTCHGEIDAIRNACKELNTFDLKGADIYTTGEPCPMCLGAILWSNINNIYYGCSIQENEMIGFRDDIFYQKLNISTNNMKNIIQIDHKECLKLFEEYKSIKNKTLY